MKAIIYGKCNLVNKPKDGRYVIVNGTEEVALELAQALKKLLEEIFKKLKRALIEFADQIDINKLIKYRKYQKRVLNRKKLFAKRKAKYGK